MKHVIRISDGLGNQLFQYACGYSVYKKTGREIEVDSMFMSTLRHYQLNAFHIDFPKRFVNPMLEWFIGFGPKHAKRPRRVYREKKVAKRKLKVVEEAVEMSYDASIYQQDEACYITGFWQSYLYFDEYYEDIKRQFQPKKAIGSRAEVYAKEMESAVSVSLHIRRTDYVRDVDDVCIQELYYKKALEQMEEKIGDFRLFIFTDDKGFVKENFKLHGYTLVEGLGDLEEFALMQKCKHHIIANSTYSWWAAYLSENKGGIVFAPVAGIWKRDFYLPQWNCIETEFKTD